MGTEENKDVVRRFIEDVATGRDVDVADDVLRRVTSTWRTRASKSLG